MGSNHTILVVEEDATCRAFLADNLAEDGYQVASAETRDQALALLANRRAHLVLADLNGQTLGLLDAVRGAGGLRDGIDPHVPLVVLSSRTDELARVRALERGADDVIAKPFSYPELRARLGAVLRRCYGRPRQVLRVGGLTLDRGTRRAWIGECEVELSVKEFELLVVLAAEPERVHTKAELLRAVWGLGSWARTRTLDSHAFRLRQKLRAAGAGDLVVSVWGVGLRLSSAPLEERA
jgi:DNA-binding response OmpR family regulator